MNLKQDRQLLYDCDRCKKSGLYKKRNCFLFGSEVQSTEVTNAVGERSKIEGIEVVDIVYTREEQVEVEVDTLLGSILPEIMSKFQNKSLFQVLIHVFGKVCPRSFVDGDVSNLLTMESFCRDYHVSPFGNHVGYLDIPSVMIESFSIISIARERVKSEEMRQYTTNSGNDK